MTRFLAAVVIATAFFYACSNPADELPQPRKLNDTFSLLTNKGTSKTWKLQSVLTIEGDTVELRPGWFEADYTYYADLHAEVSHPLYDTLYFIYVLRGNHLVLFSPTYGEIDFTILSITEEDMKLERTLYEIGRVIETYKRK